MSLNTDKSTYDLSLEHSASPIRFDNSSVKRDKLGKEFMDLEKRRHVTKMMKTRQVVKEKVYMTVVDNILSSNKRIKDLSIKSIQ